MQAVAPPSAPRMRRAPLPPGGGGRGGRADGDGYRLHGERLFVLHATSADLLVTAFRTGAAGDAISLAVVDRGADGVEVEDTPSIDATKRIGRLALDGVRIARDRVCRPEQHGSHGCRQRGQRQAAGSSMGEFCR